MVINENNSHINSFTKGMNSDQAYDQLLNTQYTYAKNIRITNNQLLGGAADYSSVREGIVAPVPKGHIAGLLPKFDDRILSVKSVDNLCVIVATNDDRDLIVYRAYINEIANKVESFELLWKSSGFWKEDEELPKQLSTVLYKELENVIKLYIAPGNTPVIVLRVDKEGEHTVRKGEPENYIYTEADYLINNRIVPEKRVYINNKISGRLKTSLILYTYRYYNKYANSTQLAPLTNKIQIIDPSRSKEIGNAEDTETSIGLSITIDVEKYSKIYERILVYRLSYIKPNADSEISLIYDGKLTEDQKTFVLNDVGIEPLQLLTIEEFSAMSGVMLVPQVIEQNQEYMFCSNVNDDTIIKDLEISVDTNPCETVKTKVVLATDLTGAIPDEGKYLFDQLGAGEGYLNVSKYLQERNVNPVLAAPSYNNIITSSLLRSLRRGETYRYGIVYYDKYGRRSDVKTIGDVNVESINDTSTMPFGVETIAGKELLLAYPIGVKIKIPQVTGINPEDIIGCQIVRRSSSDIYQDTLIQVALARPLQQGLSEINDNIIPNKQSPFYPSGFLSVNNMSIYPSYYNGINIDRYSDDTKPLRAETKNNKLFQIFSSEIDFRRDDVLSKLNVSDTKIQEQFFIPAMYSEYKTGVLNGHSFAGLEFELSIDDTEQTIGTTHITPINDEDYSPYVIDLSTLNLLSSYKIEMCLVYHTEDTEAVNYYMSKTFNGDEFSVYSFENNQIVGEALFSFTKNENIIDRLRSLIGRVNGNEIAIKTNWTGSHVVNGNGDTLPIYLRIKLYIVKSYTNNNLVLGIDRHKVKKLSIGDKKDIFYIFNYFKVGYYTHSNFNQSAEEGTVIQQIKDVKIPNWNDGFDNVLFDEDGGVRDAIKQYTGFNTSIGEYQYNNWVSFGKYDLLPGRAYAPNQGDDLPFTRELLGVMVHYGEWYNNHYGSTDNRSYLRNGFIGPGPSCFLLTTAEDTGDFPTPLIDFYTSVCNIKHASKQDNVQSDEHILFFGFGNYFELSYENGKLVSSEGDTLTVFDGDIYITPHEFTTMYKAYNFESIDTLLSTQITNYIPLESKVNTYFDYGMNLRNTNSANLMYEPGSIDGVTTQERPAHQYNMIYSDNDASNDVFTLISTDKNETNMFKLRAYFSELKSNGEFIDNFLIFKALSFIDVDSKYGLITNLLTDKNTLYYWQEHAFGKFSVNERSLINDQNGNTIMLGQAGILSRYDYISTKYGMRPQDFCARTAEQGVYWVDMNNKAVVAASGNQVVNYGEQVGIQNMINDKINIDIVPNVDYDIQNNELVCQFFGDETDKSQLVFNTKYNIPVSIYTRDYDESVYIKNHLFGLYKDETDLKFIKFNYLDNTDNVEFLDPMRLDFIVNPSVSVVKVFDNLLIVPIKRSGYQPDAEIYPFDNVDISFETDMYSKTYMKMEDQYTDREGNIQYTIARFGNENYGNRMRGKWMKVSINNNNPTIYSTISHAITKFRQSYS